MLSFSNVSGDIFSVYRELVLIFTVSSCLYREQVIADPTSIEERVSESQVVFGVNSYREMCGLHLGGSILSTSDIVLVCGHRAANRAAQVVQEIKQALEKDSSTRSCI